MLTIALGHSDDVDSPDAADEALSQCDAQLAGRAPRGGLLFAGIGYDHAVVTRRILARYPGLPLIGCTADGEFSSRLGYTEDSVLLLLFAGETIACAAGLGKGIASDPEGAARAAVDEALGQLQTPPSIVITTPDGLSANADSVVDALARALGRPEVPIAGGTSGDHHDFERAYQWRGDEVVSDALPILVLSGHLQSAVGVASGWRPLGRARTVTRAQGNVVYEIEGQPALSFYQEYFGDQGTTFFVEFPLAVYPDPASDDFYLRAPFSTDPERGSLTFSGTVPEGARVRMTHVVRDGLLRGSRLSATRARQRFEGDPALALVFSCAGRKVILGTRVADELAWIREDLGTELPILGCYSFGEIAPLGPRDGPYFHNETCVTVLIGPGSEA